MNKKKLAIFISSALGIICVLLANFPLITTVHASQEIRVATKNINFETNWEYINFPSDLKPVMINDRVYLPLRGLEGVGSISSVGWYSTYEKRLEDPDNDSLIYFAGIFFQGITYSGCFATIYHNQLDYIPVFCYDDRAEFERFLDNRLSLYHGYSVKEHKSPVPAIIVNDRMMIPLRMLEYMGYDVSWDANTRTVYISYFSI